MDYWKMDGLKEIGTNKSPCATKLDWSMCGRYVLTCVLYERLKVDNNLQIFRANGTKVLAKQQNFKELYSVQWQPHEAGVLSKPNLDKLSKVEVETKSTKPKRIFKFGAAKGGGGESTAFQQMMKSQMSTQNSSDKAPQKVDQFQYKELQA